MIIKAYRADKNAAAGGEDAWSNIAGQNVGSLVERQLEESKTLRTKIIAGKSFEAKWNDQLRGYRRGGAGGDDFAAEA